MGKSPLAIYSIIIVTQTYVRLYADMVRFGAFSCFLGGWWYGGYPFYSSVCPNLYLSKEKLVQGWIDIPLSL